MSLSPQFEDGFRAAARDAERYAPADDRPDPSEYADPATPSPTPCPDCGRPLDLCGAPGCCPPCAARAEQAPDAVWRHTHERWWKR